MSPGPAVLFVCTANVSRSPYAQIRTEETFGDQLAVGSAGIPGTTGRPMDPAMEALLPYEDEAALLHRSRILTRPMIDRFDLVLTMEFGHHMRIVDEWPDTAHKVFGLRQFVEGLDPAAAELGPRDRIERVRTALRPNSMTLDVADPYRRGRRAARRCADELDALVLALGVGFGLNAADEPPSP